MRRVKSEVGTPMEYKNTEIKLNVLVNYFNEGRINLGRVAKGYRNEFLVTGIEAPSQRWGHPRYVYFSLRRESSHEHDGRRFFGPAA